MNTVYKYGNEALLKREKTAFLCSRKVPGDVPGLVENWISSLSSDRDCVMCGDESGMEHIVFSSLLKNKIPAILVLAKAMPDSFDADADCALREGRLLVITHCDRTVHQVSSRSAHDRNMLMISFAEKVVVGYSTPGGNLDRQLSGVKNVSHLLSAENDGIYNKSALKETLKSTVAANGGVYKKYILKAWTQRQKSANGIIYFDFNCSGIEFYFKISQISEMEDRVFSRTTIYLSFNELREFYDALGDVIIHVGDGKRNEIMPETVRSKSGDINFEFTEATGDGLLMIVQAKNMPDGSLRQQSIFVNAVEIRQFYTILTDAVKIIG